MDLNTVVHRYYVSKNNTKEGVVHSLRVHLKKIFLYFNFLYFCFSITHVLYNTYETQDYLKRPYKLPPQGGPKCKEHFLAIFLFTLSYTISLFGAIDNQRYKIRMMV